jgi:hypothetical protein
METVTIGKIAFWATALLVVSFLSNQTVQSQDMGVTGGCASTKAPETVCMVGP